MREKSIEQRLVQAVKAAGGICPKLVCPGMDGMPDRMILFPGGKIAFVETKAPGEKPRPLQIARHEMLRRLGFRVYVLDNTEEIGPILDEILSPAPSVTAVTAPPSNVGAENNEQLKTGGF